MSTADGSAGRGSGVGRGSEDDDYGLVPSTADTDELDEERAAGDPDDTPSTAAYDGTTVDHGDTPGQRGSGHTAG